MMPLQQTISKPISLSGIGLHTGVTCELRFVPAPEYSGIVFRRVDLPGSPEIKAIADYVTDTRLGTTLRAGNAVVQTIEHLLAAIFALEIDNLIIEMNHSEPPIMDGSAYYFMNVLKQAGITRQSAAKNVLPITEKIIWEEPERGVFLSIEPYPILQIQVEVDYQSTILPPQTAFMQGLAHFETEIAPCRTFCFLKDVIKMYQVGLIKGGSPSNAVVIVDEPLTPESKKILNKLFPIPNLEAKEGILGTTLLFDNEPARHKLLDIIGDLSLVGMPFTGKIIARKPGHKANTALAAKIRQRYLEPVCSKG